MSASRNVLINNRLALRVGDEGVYTSPRSDRKWVATHGAARVQINDRLLHRRHDVDEHSGQEGLLLEGSPDVLVGDYLGESSRRPAVVKIRLMDIPGPRGLPLQNTRWRLLRGHVTLEQGITDNEGNVDIQGTLAPETMYRIRYPGREVSLYVSPESDPASAKGIKIRLAFLGYDVGPINGRLDTRASAALRVFQVDVGLAPGGLADEGTVAALAGAAGF